MYSTARFIRTANAWMRISEGQIIQAILYMLIPYEVLLVK